MSIEWKKIHADASGSHSKCGRFTVCRTNDAGTLWEVWKLAPGGPWFALLEKNLTSEDAAKARAEQDAA
jgi:hypothetical protein